MFYFESEIPTLPVLCPILADLLQLSTSSSLSQTMNGASFGERASPGPVQVSLHPNTLKYIDIYC